MAILKKMRQGMLYATASLGAGACGVLLLKSNYSPGYKGAITIASLLQCGMILYIWKLKRQQRLYESEIEEILEILTRMTAVHVSEKELTVAARRQATGEEATQPSAKKNRWNLLKAWIGSFGRSAEEKLPLPDNIHDQILELKLKMHQAQSRATRTELPQVRGMELYRRPRSNTARLNSMDAPVNAIRNGELFKYFEDRGPEIAKELASLEGGKYMADELTNSEEDVDIVEELENQEFMNPSFMY